MDLINEKLIDLHFHAENKDDVLNHLADLADLEGRLNDRDAYVKELYRREEEAPTNIGMQVAIPHGKNDCVKIPTLMFMKLDKPIQWNDDTADMIFGIAVPETNAGNLHLQLLAKIATKLMQDDARARFEAAASEKEIVDLLLGE